MGKSNHARGVIPAPAAPHNCILPGQTIELIEVALNAACTGITSDDTCRRVRAALEAGASRDQILLVLKMASIMSLSSRIVRAAVLETCVWNNGAQTHREAAHRH